MCGFLGGLNTAFDERSLARLAHRDPDQTSFVSEELEGLGTLTLGQTRLNVVDRRDVELPIRLRGSTILYNGE